LSAQLSGGGEGWAVVAGGRGEGARGGGEAGIVVEIMIAAEMNGIINCLLQINKIKITISQQQVNQYLLGIFLGFDLKKFSVANKRLYF
jgi:uncharacterized membrane protein